MQAGVARCGLHDRIGAISKAIPSGAQPAPACALGLFNYQSLTFPDCLGLLCCINHLIGIFLSVFQAVLILRLIATLPKPNVCQPDETSDSFVSDRAFQHISEDQDCPCFVDRQLSSPTKGG